MKTKILIVEDDPHILLGLEEVLKSDGFEVAVCNRGDLAVEAVNQHRPMADNAMGIRAAQSCAPKTT